MERSFRLRVGLILFFVVTGCSAQAEPDVQRGAAVTGRDPPVVSGPRIDTVDVPKEAPFVGDAGDLPDGQPARQPDRVALLGLLRLKRFDLLDQFMSFYQDAFEHDARKEHWPDAALSAFFVADPELEPILNEWLARSPTSFAARAARGNFRYRLGLFYRGTEFARDTERAQFRSMHEYFVAADADFREALRLRPRFMPAYVRRVRMADIDGAPDRALLDQALAACPGCFEVRAAWLEGLAPKWGGSYREMHEFAASTARLWNDHPRLKRLLGYEHEERCREATRAGEFATAHEACERALTSGDETGFLVAQAQLLQREKRLSDAVPFLDRAMQRDPHARDALKVRYFVHRDLKDHRTAADDLTVWRALDPTDDEVAKQVEFMIATLRYEGHQLDGAGKHDDAAALYARALRLAPADLDLAARLARSSQQLDLSAASIAAQLAKAPDDFELRRRIDYGLAAGRRFPEILPMWDEFLTRHPTDPRAIAERAGTLWQLGRRDQAIAEMDRACSLQLPRACSDAKGMRKKAGR